MTGAPHPYSFNLKLPLLLLPRVPKRRLRLRLLPRLLPKSKHFVDLHEAAAILGIPFTAVRRLIAEDQIPATRAGRGGKFMIARTAIAKYAERIK
jgi:excisionase family DNA binding protein